MSRSTSVEQGIPNMDKVRNARRPTTVTTDSVNKKYSKCRPAPTGGVNNYLLKIIITINNVSLLTCGFMPPRAQ